MVGSGAVGGSGVAAGGVVAAAFFRVRLAGAGAPVRRARPRPSAAASAGADTAAAAFLRDRLAGAGAGAAASALTSAGSMPGTQRSMLRRVALKLTTTSSTSSPIFMTSRALRGAGSAISRSGT